MKWIGLAVMLNMAPFVRATVDNNNPIANSKAVVICGNARFTVLTPEMIRIEYSEKACSKTVLHLQLSTVILNW